MSTLDILLLLPLIWSGYRGYSKGLIVELFSIIALIVGTFGAIQLSHLLKDKIVDLFDVSDTYLNIMAFVGTFVLIVVGIHIAAKALEKFVDMIALGGLNKAAGFLFGVLKAGIILSVFLFILEKIDPNDLIVKQELKDQSVLYKPLALIIPTFFQDMLEGLIPDATDLPTVV